MKKADQKTQVRIYNRISWQYRNSSLDKSIEYGQKALDLATEIEDDTLLSETYDYMGIAYYLHGNYQQSLKYYLESLLIKEQMQDTLSFVLTYNNLAILYSRLNNYGEALRYFRKCYQIHESNENKTQMGGSLNNIGSLYSDMDNADSALFYHQKALDIRLTLSDSTDIGYSLKNMANAYRMKGNYEAAFENFKKALKYLKNTDDQMVVANTYYYMGISYSEKGDYDRALRVLKKGLSLVEQIEQNLSVRNFKKEIAAIHYQTHDYKKAYQELLDFAELQDQIYNNESIKRIAEMRTIYETEKKEEQIELLAQEQAKQEKKIKSQTLSLKRTQTQLIILTLAFLTTIITFMFLRNRNRYRQKELLNYQQLRYRESQIQSIINAQEKERERFARDIHDSVGSGLSALKMNISNLDPDNKGIRSKNKDIYSNSLDILDDIHKEIRNISFNLKPKILASQGLLPVLEEMIRRINTIGKINVSLNVFDFETRLPTDVEINTYRVLQEILNNIMKHSNAQHVSIQLTKYESEINLMVEDDGTGFDIQDLKKNNSYGWDNIISRLELINGKHEIDTMPGRKGTTVIIDIPLQNDKTRIGTNT
ncbi:MAG: sensor histidine kinase [Bacteroidales bacterium]|nr:sensor histidine kinase [Bacteroidales bacterium]